MNRLLAARGQRCHLVTGGKLVVIPLALGAHVTTVSAAVLGLLTLVAYFARHRFMIQVKVGLKEVISTRYNNRIFA